MRRLAIVLVLVGCGGMEVLPPPAPDAAIEPPPRQDCPARPALEGFSFFGEPCDADPRPDVNTLCRGIDGWCVAGVCRPSCAIPGAPSCAACPAGTEHHAPAGACYCAPLLSEGL